MGYVLVDQSSHNRLFFRAQFYNHKNIILFQGVGAVGCRRALSFSPLNPPTLEMEALFSFQAQCSYEEAVGPLTGAVFFLSAATVFFRGLVFSLIEQP